MTTKDNWGGRPRRDLELQAHIAEFEATRAEMLDHMKRRENLRLATIAVAGALFSFAFGASQGPDPRFPSALALFLVVPLTLQLGAVSSISLSRLNRLAAYNKDFLAPRLGRLLYGPEVMDQPEFHRVWSWGSFPAKQRWAAEKRRWMTETLTDWAVNTGVYIVPGIIAQSILSQSHLRLLYNWVYVSNWAIVLVALTWKFAKLTHILSAWRAESKRALLQQGD